MEVAEESDAKRRAQDIEIEKQTREQARKHEERMMTMMMTFLHQSNGHSLSQHSAYNFSHYPYAPDGSFSSCSNPTADTDVDYYNQDNQ